MAAITSFNSTTSARIRCAEHILGTPSSLAYYEDLGGVSEELQSVIDYGKLARDFNSAQGLAGAFSKVSTADIVTLFAKIRDDYSVIMGAVQAGRLELAKKNASAETIGALDAILANSSEVTMTTLKRDGVKKRKRRASNSQEAIRNEIEKDAIALLGLTDAHEVLGRRKVTKERLEALLADAQQLSGKLSTRASKSKDKVVATKEEREAVKQQSEVWAACYRILAAVGARDPSVQSILKEATARK
jgi:hypothetical protein